MTIIWPDIGLIYSFLTAECIDLTLIPPIKVCVSRT